MAKSANSMKTVAVNAPTTREGAEAAMKSIGELQRDITRRETNMNDEINTIKARYQEEISPLNEEIKSQFSGLHAYAEANKADLLTGRTKTVKMGAGEISWRINPSKVSIRGADAVVEALERYKLTEFIRTKKEPNKEAILNDPDRVKDIKGINITQTEEFVVKPYETALERVEVMK